jgi:V/A-type H+-transporting ATPase subunit D
MEQVSPTRTNLLTRRAQITLARQGADLLSRKKDALLGELFARLADTYRLRSRLADRIRRETAAGVVAEGVHGPHAFAAAALAAESDYKLHIEDRNFWGVKVVELDHDYQPRDVLDRPCSPRNAEFSVDETAEGFEHVVRDMLDLAPRELWLKKIGLEIKKTNRKINALEQQLIPQLQAQAEAIAEALEERARDDRFRLKRLKRKKEMAAREAARCHSGKAGHPADAGPDEAGCD